MGILESLVARWSRSQAPIAHSDEKEISRREPVEPGFMTAKWVIREAFDRVTLNINLSAEIKERIFLRFAKAHRDGSPRGEELAVFSELCCVEWCWPEFDAFLAQFAHEKEWPYMWTPELYEQEIQTPETIESAVDYMTVKDMKSLIAERPIVIKPMPKRRDEIMAVVINNFTLDEILEKIKPLVDQAIERHRLEKIRGKCHLLAHTIAMTTYSLRDKAQFDRLSEHGNYRLMILEGVGCPVEKRYAAMFNRGEIDGLPPFFPGDRNCFTTVRS